MIKIAAENMNKTVSAKYGIVPENIEVRIQKMEIFSRSLRFYETKKIQNNEMRVDKYSQRIDRRKKTFRSPLNIG